MVIGKLCSNDYDFKGKGRATPKAASAVSSSQPQVFAVPLGPVRTPIPIVAKATSPDRALAKATSPGCATAEATNTTKAKTTSPPPAAASLCESSASTSTSGSSSSSTTLYTDSTMSSAGETVKLPKLSDADKASIVLLYDSLDKGKMWKLSTGTFVEEKMRECALGKDHEHLAHSLILNVKDNDWYNYFSPEEMDEIASYFPVDFPPVAELDTYLNKLESLSSEELYEKLVSEKLPLASNDKWIQDSFYQCLRLLKSGFLPLVNGQSEGGLGKRMWSCIDPCFDFCQIDCKSGEKCSRSSADAMNAGRTNLQSRQATGRKMDYLFQYSGKTEVGCGECGLAGGVNSTKELYDAYFKLPKVMKDMMINLLSLSPSLKRDLVISGFYIGQSKLTLQVLDCPAGYVARYDAFNPVMYPDTESQLHRKMSAVLKVIFAGRVIMEETARKLDQDQSRVSLGRQHDENILPCFVPVKTCNNNNNNNNNNNKKRKR
ncbi:hypothetical protein FB192DRAFT_1385901 [Mucor lusitanicus]|nr:hypothetical protein FB192DRAFT_1385901 [Mucor lusitanicus]